MNWDDDLQRCQSAERVEILIYEHLFNIINSKDIDVWLVKHCDYENYCRIRKLTKEEYNLLKESLNGKED